ncbi:MAG: SGNH/GDSL hydrolase family protein [Spirochaetaceae bacterium]|jgi:hypothetical protein|nr:SGNH/GDSL hydrolase family protein [Spirochaetaceae bacterium]
MSGEKNQLKYIDAFTPPFSLGGLFYDEDENAYLRIPTAVANKISPNVARFSRLTSGGRVRFKTDAQQISIRARCEKPVLRAHISILGTCGFSLYLNDEFVRSFLPGLESVTEQGFFYEGACDLPPGMKDLTLFFPVYSEVRALEIGLNSNCTVFAPEEYKTEGTVVFYGSSITHGGCVSRPGNTYPDRLCRQLSCNYINLGVDASAKGETNMAEYIAGLKPSLFVMDYDHNAPSPEHLAKTHEPFYRHFRLLCPDTPVIFISKPDYRADRPEDEERRGIILSTYHHAQENNEPVYFADGRDLFATCDRLGCTVDGIHPNDLGFYRISEYLYRLITENNLLLQGSPRYEVD